MPRLAAALRNSKSAQGADNRGRCARMDKGKAVKAPAHRLARLSYTMLTRGQESMGQGYFEECHLQRAADSLSRSAQQSLA
jgi:transposase